jgi:hypothetical protein
MSQLFGRTCTLTLGTTQINLAQRSIVANVAAQLTGSQVGPEESGGLAVVFRVKKNLKPEPNTVEIKVWNLSPATRHMLEQPPLFSGSGLSQTQIVGALVGALNGTATLPPPLLPVQLDVGYGGDNHTIYLGQLRGATSEIDGPNIITSISSGDSEQAFAAQRVNFTMPAQATAQQVFATAAQAVGVGAGNVAQAIAAAKATTGGPARKFMGAASRIFGQHARANGLQWSVQDGALQVMPIGQAVGTAATAVVLNAQSGLIGSPSIDNKGIVKCEALIQPGLTPGLPLVIQSANVNGAFRIEDSEFNGATWGAPWTVTIHAKKWS